MKKMLLAGTAGLAMVAGAPAMAEPNGPYVAGDIGWHSPSTDAEFCTGATCVDADVELDGGAVLFGRFGTRLNPAFRLEAELGQRWGQIDTVSGVAPTDDTDANATSLMANALFDFGSGRARPFIGAGVGWARVTLDDGTDSLDDSGLAWQLLAGLAMATGPRGNFDINVSPEATITVSASFADQLLRLPRSDDSGVPGLATNVYGGPGRSPPWESCRGPSGHSRICPRRSRRTCAARSG